MAIWDPEKIVNLFCAHTPVPTDAIAMHNGGTSRAFEGDTTHWSSLNGLTKAECAVRRRLGVRGNAFLLPLCLLGLLLLLVLAAGLAACGARGLRARKSKR